MFKLPWEQNRVYILILIVTVLLTATAFIRPNRDEFLRTEQGNTEDSRQPLSGKIKRELKLSARYAVATYCLPHRIKKWKCGSRCPGKLKIRAYFTSPAGVAGYVGWDKYSRRIVVAFRGSIDYRNWVWDLQFAKIDYPYPPKETDVPVTIPNQTQSPLNETQPMIHSGFWISYMSVRKVVLETVRDILLTETSASKQSQNNARPCLSVLVTGHSLGAALATFAALDIQAFQSSDGFAELDFSLVLHQFGGPRVGNRAFADIVRKTFISLKDDDNTNRVPEIQNFSRALRVVNQNEWVTHLPPTRFGFVHHPHEIWIADAPEHSFHRSFKATKFCGSRSHHPLPGPAYSCDHDLQSPDFTEDPLCSSKVPWWQWRLETHGQIWTYDVTVIC